MSDNLFGLPPLKRWKGLYAATPGTGPEGKQCRHCEHYRRLEYSKVYRKCGLMEQHWTGGAATDIKGTAPACKKFEEARDE